MKENQIFEKKTYFNEQSILVHSAFLLTPGGSEIQANTDTLVYGCKLKMPVSQQNKVCLREVNVTAGVENIDTDEFYNINSILSGRIEGVRVEGTSSDPSANGAFTTPTLVQESNVVQFKTSDAPVEFRGLVTVISGEVEIFFLIPLAHLPFDPSPTARAKIVIGFTTTWEFE